MIQFPNCKINLGLSIIAKRTDGYHELETVFYPVGLKDIVEVVRASDLSAPVEFTSTGIEVPGEIANNLCVKAYELLKAAYPALPAVKIHLHKHIPMGAGLGGGSSDATAVLKLLNQVFNLSLTQAQLINYAAQLGSDCPFFVLDTPCHATGRGEILNPIQLDLSNYSIALIHPGVHIATSWAFQQLAPHEKEKSIATIIAQDIETWKQELVNDFEAPIFLAHPYLAELKEMLYKEGAIYASMSGSGSSLFGIFPKAQASNKNLVSNKYRIDWI
jgi:4-diphosphocytidyl-2-C-methyl-D-erythritol kinase